MVLCDALRCASAAVPPPPAPYAQAPGQEPRCVNAIFVKTRFCRFNGMGLCTRGDSCKFAHSKEERKPLPNLKCTKLCPNLGSCDNESCRFAHNRDELRTLEKSSQECASVAQMARRPSNNSNKFSASAFLSCDSTALGTEDLDTFSESTSSEPTSPVLPLLKASSAPPAGTSAGFAQHGGRTAKPTAADLQNGPARFARTKMCKFYLAGKCVKQNACNFAHGQKDLRPTPDLSCTKMCPSLIAYGRCRTKGCAYAHDRERLRGNGGASDDAASRRRPAADTIQTVQDTSPQMHPTEEEEPCSPEPFRTSGHFSSGQGGGPPQSLLEAAPPQPQLASMFTIPASLVVLVPQPAVKPRAPQPIIQPCGFVLPVTQATPWQPQGQQQVQQQQEQQQQQLPKHQHQQQQPVASSAAQPQLLPAPPSGPIGIPSEAKLLSSHTSSTLDTVPSSVDHASWRGSCSSFGTNASSFVADEGKADGLSLWSRCSSFGDDDREEDVAVRHMPTDSDVDWSNEITVISPSFRNQEAVNWDDITLEGEGDFSWDGDWNQDVFVRNTFLEVLPSIPDLDSVRRNSAPGMFGGASFDDED